MSKPDILIFMSDQHTPLRSGFGGDKIVLTPNLDNIAQNGTVFDAAYTACPLCVPARSAMLTGRLPSSTGIFTNSGAIPQDDATFVHCLGIEGYETVLCGRMHFNGPDQRHGFTKRIIGDFTTNIPGTNYQFKKDLGRFEGSVGMRGCTEIIEGGNSPVLDYDKAVINAAKEYLQQEHSKPQVIVIGTYGPHFPYVAPEDLYEYYKSHTELPSVLRYEYNYRHPAIASKEMEASEQDIMNAHAAYFALITHMDSQIGEVYTLWKEYLKKMLVKGSLFICRTMEIL